MRAVRAYHVLSTRLHLAIARAMRLCALNLTQKVVRMTTPPRPTLITCLHKLLMVKLRLLH